MGGLTNALGLGIVLTLQDKVSAGLAQLQSRLVTFGNVSKDMMKKFDEGARQMIGGFTSMIAGYKIFGSFDNMFGTSVAVSRSFEMSMARVQAVSGTTGETFNALREQALEMGRTTKFTAMDAAGAQENLIRTGRNAVDTMAMLPNVLKLASAEGLSLTESADIVSSTLRMFNLDATNAARVANVLAEASRSTAGDVRSIYQALSYSGGTMGQTLGYSLEDTVTWLGVLHNAVQRASRSGMGLRRVMARLTDPKIQEKLTTQLGITITDNSSPEAILTQLNEVRKKMSPNKFLGLLQGIFLLQGTEPVIAMMKALDEANNEFATLRAKIDSSSNAAFEMSNIMDNTSQGAMFRLTSATEALRIAIGDQLRGAYDWIIGKMADFKGWLTQLIKSHPTLTKTIVGLIGVLTTLAGTFLIVTGAVMTIGGFVKMWQFLAPAAKLAFTMIKAGAVSTISTLWSMSAPVLALIGLAYGLYKAYEKNLFGIRDLFDAIGQGFYMGFNTDENGNIELLTEDIEKMKKAGIWEGALNVGMALYRFKEMWNGFVEGFKQPFIEVKYIIDELIKAISPAVENSKALLKILGFNVDSQVSSWKNLGRIIGYVTGAIVIFGIAFKTIEAAIAIVHGLYWAFSGLFTLVAANPIAAAILAVIGLIVLLYIYWDDFADWIKQLWQDIKLYVNGVIEFWKGIFNAFIGIITLDWNRFVDGLKSAFAGLRDMVAGVLNFISDLLKPIVATIEKILFWLGLMETDPVKIQEEQKQILQNQIQFSTPEEIQNLIKDFEAAREYNLNDPEALKQIDEHLEILKGALNPPAQLPVNNSNVPVEVISSPAPQLPIETKESGQSSSYIIQHNQNQAAMNGDAAVSAMNSAGGLTAEVTNNVDVKIETSTTPVNIDGEKIGEIATRYQENHATRLGRAGIFGGFE